MALTSIERTCAYELICMIEKFGPDNSIISNRAEKQLRVFNLISSRYYTHLPFSTRQILSTYTISSTKIHPGIHVSLNRLITGSFQLTISIRGKKQSDSIILSSYHEALNTIVILQSLIEQSSDETITSKVLTNS